MHGEGARMVYRQSMDRDREELYVYVRLVVCLQHFSRANPFPQRFR